MAHDVSDVNPMRSSRLCTGAGLEENNSPDVSMLNRSARLRGGGMGNVNGPRNPPRTIGGASLKCRHMPVLITFVAAISVK